MADTIAGISDEAVENATGERWPYWLELLDAEGGPELDHKERVAVLAASGVESGWWQQQLAVGYERERGLREVGQTADAGYQVGTQRTLGVGAARLWDLLVGEGVSLWLGEIDDIAFEPGETYTTAEGLTGEIRTKKNGERIRLTWQPVERERSTTLQLTLEEKAADPPKTVLRIHHEKLADTDEREERKAEWRAVLDAIEQRLG